MHREHVDLYQERNGRKALKGRKQREGLRLEMTVPAAVCRLAAGSSFRTSPRPPRTAGKPRPCSSRG